MAALARRTGADGSLAGVEFVTTTLGLVLEGEGAASSTGAVPDVVLVGDAVASTGDGLAEAVLSDEPLAVADGALDAVLSDEALGVADGALEGGALADGAATNASVWR
jgi:hypothetical protein